MITDPGLTCLSFTDSAKVLAFLVRRLQSLDLSIKKLSWEKEVPSLLSVQVLAQADLLTIMSCRRHM